MAGFRSVKVGGDNAAKHILKFESGKGYIVKIIEDDLHQWNEVWPSFIGDQGVVMRRFVCDEENTNIASINSFRKENDISKICNGDKRLVNNWNAKMQFAVLAIIGIEQKVKDEKTGTIKRKIAWDKTAKIYQFGVSAFRKLESINHNPTLIEAAEAKGLKMADPDDENAEGYLCTDVYALRVTKDKKGQKTEYIIEADRLVGVIKKDIADVDTVKKDLAEHIKSSKETDVESFLNQITGNSSSSEEAASTDDSDAESPVEEEKPVAKKGKAPAKESNEVEDVELGDGEEAEKPVAKTSKKKDEDDLDLGDIELDEVA